MIFTVTVCGWNWTENDISSFNYLLDIAKVNFSVIILNSGFYVLGLPRERLLHPILEKRKISDLIEVLKESHHDFTEGK